MWMDHRATKEAQLMTDSGHAVLRNTGGKISPEMSAAKILWLHKNHPTSWSQTTTLIELPDFLTAKASGSLRRSVCSVACKWTFVEHAGGWAEQFWQAVGLYDVVKEKFARFGGDELCLPGERIGVLSEGAAREMGLEGCEGVAVGGSLIDAYSGALGTLGASLDANKPSRESLSNRMAVICGTSSCHIALAPQPHYVNGVWGPYANVLLKGMHCAEGGQSATGKTLDFVLSLHPAITQAKQEASAKNISVYEYLNDRLQALAQEQNVPFIAYLTKDLHVSPDFHGNRSPIADPSIRGGIMCLDLDGTLDALTTLYLATILALVYGTRHIVETLNQNGYTVDTLFLSGGLTKNKVFVKAMSDACGMKVVLPMEEDAVLLGSAMLGAAAAARGEGDLWERMVGMGRAGEVLEPCGGEESEFHDRKYRVFLRMYEQQEELRRIMG
ncbi:hypothetical protein HDV00_011842 [Rhizophlyctis rosea]|nr:hypothetical protein HDV00_011842 [Rhizophlyctis rosea]